MNQVLSTRVFLSVAFSVSSLLLAFTLAWIVLAKQNFLYPVWHDIGGIGAGIDKFAPKNRYKPGFGDTSPEERSNLFAQINTAIHQHGSGLAQIKYQTSSSNGEQFLLRTPEVKHLQDVANLIDKLFLVVTVNVFVWLGLIFTILRVRLRLLSWVSQIGGVGSFIFFSTLCVLIIGPVKVFNQLHIWVFPKDNEWFFYYQDSLMSTLMMAPNLFGWIAGSLLVMAIIIFLLILLLSINFERRFKTFLFEKA